MVRAWIGWRYAREIAAAVAIVSACLGWRLATGTRAADAKPPERKAASAPAAPGAKPLALVNGTEITADRLGAECLTRHGAAVLESLVNRRIIEQACQRRGVKVTRQDVDAEIDALAKRFSVPRDKWLELIQQERDITPEQYADDIVWSMLALRRLAQGAVEPSAEEVQAAFEKEFGPAVKARIIVSRTRQDAEKARTAALAAPDDFGGLARKLSADVGSASANGWVQPIRLHSGEPAFDRAAFALQPGEISPVIQVADQFIIIRCEGHLPAADVKPEDVRPRLAEQLRDQKSRQASNDVFRKLQDASTIENVLNDPLREWRPGSTGRRFPSTRCGR